MIRWASSLSVLALLLASTSAAASPVPSFKLRSLEVMEGLQPLLLPQLLAQSDEPAPPGGATPAAPAAPVKSDEPGAKTGEPGAAKTDEPGGAKAGEPGAAATAVPAEEPPPVVKKVNKEVSYGAGFQFRGVFVPFLGLFLDAHTDLASVALGGEFIRRKGNMDIVASVNFGFYSPPDGNYLGGGNPPSVDTDYIQFRDLNVLSFDVAFIWHHHFNSWVSLVYGAGLGIGVVLGDIFRISTFQGKCNHENVDNIDECNPVNPNDAAGLAKWKDNPDAWLADQQACTGGDDPLNPCQFREEDVWPVIPVLHLLIGVNFKINEQFSVRVDGGFHNAFYVGAATHYFF
jgi:hypothetical protein